MKTTKIKVTELTHEEMLQHPNQAYNPSIWKERVNRMIELGAKFYEAKPDELYSYSRFFVEYKLKSEGLYFLRTFDPFMSALTNNGFTRAYIVDGEIFTNGFGSDYTSRVMNSKEGRKWLAENICNNEIMVTSCL